MVYIIAKRKITKYQFTDITEATHLIRWQNKRVKNIYMYICTREYTRFRRKMKKTELRVINNRKMRNIAKDQRWLSQRSHRLCQEFTIKKFKNHQKPNRKIKQWSYRSTCIWFYSNNKYYERWIDWKFHFCTIIQYIRAVDWISKSLIEQYVWINGSILEILEFIQGQHVDTGYVFTLTS